MMLLVCFLAAGCMWFYVDQVLKPQQVADAALHNRPRGNLSDLYPRWLGARELLLHGRNPYSNEITAEIQKGYYGRLLNPSLPDDPKDRQAFAYPVYVVFLLAPAIKLPFELVQVWFRWILVLLAVAGVWCWLRVLQWRLSLPAKILCVVLLLGSFPEVQGIRLQQLSLLVAALLAAGAACVATGFLFLGGAILALATIKPQLALPLAAALLLWAASDWKTRWRLLAGFATIMGLLLAASEFLLPGWWRMFWQAMRDYRQYTGSQSVLDQLVNWELGPRGGEILAALAVLACGALLWRLGSHAFASESFGHAIALVMALTVLIVPMYAPYNQVLLVPAILLLVRERKDLTSNSRPMRMIYALGIFVFAWPWLASLMLTMVCRFSRTSAMAAWKLPLYATFALPVLVFMLTLICVRQHAVLRVRDASR
jgi:Glycosyltransferase family 87